MANRNEVNHIQNQNLHIQENAFIYLYLVYEVRRLCHEDVLDDGNPVGVERRRRVLRSGGVVLGLGREK